MSATYLIYLDSASDFDRADFEAWTLAHGYEVELPPNFSVHGEYFVNIRFRADFLGESSWLTGFELFSVPNWRAVPADERVLEEAPARKDGFFARLFGRGESGKDKKSFFRFASAKKEPSPVEVAIREKAWFISAICHAREPLEELVSYLFAAYFCDRFGAVVDDPQAGLCFTRPDEIIGRFEAVKQEMLDDYKSWGLEFIAFKGWDSV